MNPSTPTSGPTTVEHRTEEDEMSETTAAELAAEMYAQSKLAATTTDRSAKAQAAGAAFRAKTALEALGISVTETAVQIAARLGVPVTWAAGHTGPGMHVCVDGRHYKGSCLASDPTCEYLYRYSLRAR
jgi:hypothetical protein